MEFGKAEWRSFERGIEKEWLLTNGIGGFSSSTIIGANTRRYHGLLTAALNPPVARHLILSKLDESLTTDGQTHNLYSHKTPDYTMEGFLYQQRIVLDPLPVFIYNIADTFIEKKVGMVHGENTVVIVYSIKNGVSNTIMRLAPLVNFRDYHFNSSRAHMQFVSKSYPGGISIQPYNMDINIKLHCSEGIFKNLEDCWFYNMDYPVEKERGLHSTEDHYIPGYFEVEIPPLQQKIITVIATIEDEMVVRDGPALLDAEERRIRSVINTAGYEDCFARMLVKAADDFIVYRKSTGTKTVIAGYPWFTDWGRDTMIAFTGLTLATKRFEDAREILYTFSRYVRNGLLPNVFPDAGQEPAYNCVDSSLWYFEAVNKYIKYTGDLEFIQKDIFPVLKEIVKFYTEGTLFNIHMDRDHLISAGDRGTQLTWMDAKVGDWVVTPRHGKAVEINALWYNALRVLAMLCGEYGEDRAYYDGMAEKVREAFGKAFWNEDRQCLYDVVCEGVKDDKIRPNQIIAVSLTNPVIDGYRARCVVERVMKHLYTAYGLRSLSAESQDYVGLYLGDPFRRDGAYHQGTVWAWLMGPFISAYVKVYGNTPYAREMALRIVKPFMDHLYDGCLGSISEIFDGDEPHAPRGCFAQAWSVGEILRSYTEDILQ